MSSANTPTSDDTEFVNPFKEGELENPGVDRHESRKRTEQKLNQLKPEHSAKKSK